MVIELFTKVAPGIYGAKWKVVVPCLSYVLGDDYEGFYHGEFVPPAAATAAL